MSNTHCRFCNITVKGIYLNCPKCGKYLVPGRRGKTIPPEPYELAEQSTNPNTPPQYILSKLNNGYLGQIRVKVK